MDVWKKFFIVRDKKNRRGFYYFSLLFFKSNIFYVLRLEKKSGIKKIKKSFAQIYRIERERK